MERRAEATVGDTTVWVARGDLTTAAVDVIVNAANTSLRHGGGVALAIARGAGPELQRASDDWVRRHGELTDGQAAVTTAGDLGARAVVHVAGPIHDPDRDDNEARLRAAVRAALDATAGEGHRSIAFPAISAGIYGYPPDAATAVLADEVVRWLRDHGGTLDEVVVVGYDDAMADRFAAALAATTSP